MRNFKEFTNSSSEIKSCDHQRALLRIQIGISSVEAFPDEITFESIIILFSNINSIPDTKSESVISPIAHYPALFLIQSGTEIGSMYPKIWHRES